MSRSRYYVQRRNSLDRDYYENFLRQRDTIRTRGDRHRVEVAGAGVPKAPRGLETIADCPPIVPKHLSGWRAVYLTISNLRV